MQPIMHCDRNTQVSQLTDFITIIREGIRMTEIIELTDEAGNVDRCEVEAQGTRVIRVIERIATAVPDGDGGDRAYQSGYAYACGYHD